MAKARDAGKLYPLFITTSDHAPVSTGEEVAMSYLATAIFVALFMVGPTYFGWSDPGSKVSIALMTCFVLGSVAGYKARN
jgi:hypothetical protein